MEAQETLTLYDFPPTAIVFIACLVKLFAMLEGKEITWGRSFVIAVIISLVLLSGWALHAYF